MEGTELASTKVKKKKKRDPSEKGRHPVACQKWKVPRDSTHLTAVNHIKSPPLDNLDSDLEDEPSLVIAEEVKVKSKKIKVKKDKSVKITTGKSVLLVSFSLFCNLQILTGKMNAYITSYVLSLSQKFPLQ